MTLKRKDPLVSGWFGGGGFKAPPLPRKCDGMDKDFFFGGENKAGHVCLGDASKFSFVVGYSMRRRRRKRAKGALIWPVCTTHTH